jgi:hypothetical protein
MANVKGRAPQRIAQRAVQRAPQRMSEEEAALAREVDDALTRLDIGITEERKQMEELLGRLRTTRVAA